MAGMQSGVALAVSAARIDQTGRMTTPVQHATTTVPTGATRPSRRFPIRLGPRSRPILRLFGAREETAFVEVGEELLARFGWSTLRTPVSNIASWRIEGPWLWLTAIGLRRGIRGGDFTFGGNHRGGVRLDFHEPVPFFAFKPRALYVTVADLEGFAAALAELGIPGRDARTGPTD
jgi:hypothetical protein